MDCSSGAFVGAITTYESGSRDHTESQESSARSTTLETGDLVKLFADGFGEVGLASVVEARPQGEWLGVVIPVEPWLFVLLQPQSFITEAQQLRMNPCQRGLSSFMDAINRTVLWRATDILKVSGDSPSNSTTYIRQDDWPGREVHRKDSEGVLLSSGRVFCYKPDDYFQDSTLGEDQVGVTVLDVFVGDRDAIMSHARWPTSECWFPNGRSLKETVDYFANIPDVPDPLAFLGGISKAPYRFVVRKRRSIDKVSAFLRKTTDAEIRKVSSERCCSRQCCQFFPRETTLKVREIFYSKSFEGRKEYGIAAGGHLREVDWTKKLRYLMLEEFDVCATAWYIIHGIPKSTFHNYVHKYNQKVLSTTHGNRGVKRPRIATVQVTGTVKAIIDENADQMPHQMRGIGHGRKDTRKLLPSVHNWKRIRLDANQLNVDYGLPVVSQSTISRIKKDHFNNVSIKAVGSSFAKCSTCDSLQQFILKSPKGSPDYVVFTRQRNLHLNHQASCRRLYASWREESKRNPQEILCIIHDKMDTAKTALPRMRVTTKATQGLGQLPMSVTGMVSHGHGDGAYAHYAPSVWPGDSNFTISSLARLLCRLEGPPIRETGHLFPHPPANPLFEALLRGKSRCMNILKLIEPSSRRGSLPLPPKLFLQLDNSAKDNKNQYLMAFLSLLTARGVFKEIQVGFLLVGHTHEDIDSYFSHLSTSLKGENTYVVADLMKQFMESQELSFMPEFVQEVGDFKSFVKGYLCTGTTRIIGLGEMHLFRFYVENDGVPVMKYKKSAIDSHWLPSDTTSRCLWKRDHQGRAMLPHGCPKPAEFKPVWGSEVPKATGNQEKARELAHKATVNKGFILSGLEKHILYWQSGIKKCRGFAAAFSPYVEYWQRVLLELKAGPPDCPAELLEGFWPSHDWRQSPTESTVGQSTVNPLDMVPEEEAPEPYCGPANEAPRESFNPWFDIRPGSWVLLRPEDPSVCDVWQGRALSEVCKEAGHEKIGKFMIQYWRPDNSESTLELRYRNCWYGKWVVEESGPAWVDAACVVYATWSKVVNPKSRTIPKKSREAALANLTRSNEVDP